MLIVFFIIAFLMPSPVLAAGGKVTIVHASNSGFMEKSLSADKELNVTAENIANTFLLPEPLTISFEECDGDVIITPHKKIAICYNLLRQTMAKMAEGNARITPQSVAHYIVRHIAAHYILDRFDIKSDEITEDSYDELVSLMLLAESEKLPQTSIEDAVRFSDWVSKNKEMLSGIKFWEQHGPDQARAESMACMVYGSDPVKFTKMASDLGLSKEFTSQCQDQLSQMQDNWSHLLNAYLRDAPKEP